MNAKYIINCIEAGMPFKIALRDNEWLSLKFLFRLLHINKSFDLIMKYRLMLNVIVRNI